MNDVDAGRGDRLHRPLGLQGGVSVANAVASITAQVTIANFISNSLRVSQSTKERMGPAGAIVPFAVKAIVLTARAPIILMLAPRCGDRTIVMSGARQLCHAMQLRTADVLTSRSCRDGDDDGARRQRRSEAP